MMVMTLSSDQLDAFLAVAQLASFTKAAASLHITQSALSQRIIKLEAELETTLFIRDRAGLRLTEAAEALVRYCRCKNALEEEFRGSLRQRESAGVIRIGGFSSVMQSVVLPSLSDLLVTSPLKFQMIVDEMEALPARLRRGEIDYMILDHRAEREGIERVLLGKEQNVLVQKRKYRGPEIYLDHDEADETTRAYLRLSKRKPKVLERRYLSNIYGLLEGVRLGIGRAVIPRHLIRGDSDFEIVDDATVLEIPVYLYYYAQPFYPKLHAHIVDALRSGARGLL